MKPLLLALPIIALTACQQSPAIALDDPRRAEADARLADTIFGASGISGLAYIGSSSRDDGANLSYDNRYTTAAEVAAAPTNVCAKLNGTVKTTQVDPHRSAVFGENVRILIITCNV